MKLFFLLFQETTAHGIGNVIGIVIAMVFIIWFLTFRKKKGDDSTPDDANKMT
jgi:hypothetical protein